jgi:precorrin-2 dehydrogenase / sirohydrochlorin ferrochelatase
VRGPGDRGIPYYPAFLDLARKRVVVVGGGAVASTKVAGLLPCGVQPLVVVAPSAADVIQASARAGLLEWHPRSYQPGDLDQADLAFAASDDRALNARVATEARQRGIPVLAVDDVPNCDFIAPALVRRGDLTIAISTHGRSPAMARRVREWLDANLPSHWGRLLDVAATARDRLGPVRAAVPAAAWQSEIDGAVEDLAREDEVETATAVLEAALRRHTDEHQAEVRNGPLHHAEVRA